MLLHFTLQVESHDGRVIFKSIDDLTLILPIILQCDVIDDERGVVLAVVQEVHAAVEGTVALFVEAHGYKHIDLLQVV